MTAQSIDHHTPAPAGVFISEGAMAEPGYQQLVERNQQLESEKHSTIDWAEEEKAGRLEALSALTALVSATETFECYMKSYGTGEALNNARRLVKQTQSEGE